MRFDPTLQCLTGWIKLNLPTFWQKLLTGIGQSCAKQPFGWGTEASCHIWQWKAFQPVQTFADTAAENLGIRDLDLGSLSTQRCSSCKTFIHLHLHVSYTFKKKIKAGLKRKQSENIPRNLRSSWVLVGFQAHDVDCNGLCPSPPNLSARYPLHTGGLSQQRHKHTVGCSSTCVCSFAMHEWWTTGFRLKIESRILVVRKACKMKGLASAAELARQKTWFLSIWRVFACWQVPSPANGQVSSPSPRHWRLKNKVNTSARGGEVTQKMTFVPATH